MKELFVLLGGLPLGTHMLGQIANATSDSHNGQQKEKSRTSTASFWSLASIVGCSERKMRGERVSDP